MKIVYLVHDVSDPAAERRIAMLRAGGAEVSVAGFRRHDLPLTVLAGAPVVDLGRTYDARLGQRALETARWAIGGRLGTQLRGADVILARNLEMLALAAATRRTIGPGAPLVYECLDIHRLMFSGKAAGRLLRLVERRLMARCEMLIVSSQAFVDSYFEPVQHISKLGLKTLLVENRQLVLDDLPPMAALRRSVGRPWRIGWFGILRCRESLNLLTALAARRPDLVEVTCRGRPTLAVFQDFAAEIEGVPSMTFGGAYGPEDLTDLYREQHFAWAVDYYDRGKNSALLIPNRLYDAGASRCIPIALGDVEAGRWLARHGLGVLLRDPLRELEAFFEGLTEQDYGRLQAQAAAADPTLFRAGRSDCERLCGVLAGLSPQARANDHDPERLTPFEPSLARGALSQ